MPTEELIWQDPIPKNNYNLVNDTDIKKLKDIITNSELTNSELISNKQHPHQHTEVSTEKRGC